MRAPLLVATTIVAALARIAQGQPPSKPGKKPTPPKLAPLSGQVVRGDHVRVTLRATIPQTKPDGSAWDLDGSAPDTVVTAIIGNRKLPSTDKTEGFTPQWGPFVVRVHPGTPVRLSLWDIDTISEPDHVATFSIVYDGTRGNNCYGATSGRGTLCIERKTVDVWEIPEFQVSTTFPVDDASESSIRRILVDFNRRLVDATDGQIRIRAFSLYSPPWPVGFNPHAARSAHLHREWKDADAELPNHHLGEHPKDAAGCAHLGRPRMPSAIHAALAVGGVDQSRPLAGTLLHEMGHAWFGLGDEYLSVDDPRPGCPDADLTGSYCFMNAGGVAREETCRPYNHDENSDTLQAQYHRMSCWSWMTKVIAEDIGIQMLDDPPMPGPEPFTAPIIRVWRGGTWKSK